MTIQEKNDLRPYCRDQHLSRYLPIPRAALSWDLSLAALMAYGLLLDRADLSRTNGWADKASGELYVVYPLARLARALGRSETTVKRVLKELSDNGLIRRDRTEGYYTRFYLRAPRESLRYEDGSLPAAFPGGGEGPELDREDHVPERGAVPTEEFSDEVPEWGAPLREDAGPEAAEEEWPTEAPVADLPPAEDPGPADGGEEAPPEPGGAEPSGERERPVLWKGRPCANRLWEKRLREYREMGIYP